MGMLLEDLVTTEVKEMPSAIILAGPPGVGKSTIIGNIPDVLVIAMKREDTWSLLKRSGAVPKDLATTKKPVDNWTDLMTILETLLSESIDELPYQCLAIDSLTPLQSVLFKHVLENRFGGDEKAFNNYASGPRGAVPTWERFLDTLDRIRSVRGMATVLTAHIATKSHSDAEGEDYDRTTVALDKNLWEKTYPWADAVLFAKYRTVTKEGKIKGGAQRYLVTGGVAACDAKNRYGFPKEIDMGSDGRQAWDNIVDQITKCQSKE